MSNHGNFSLLAPEIKYPDMKTRSIVDDLTNSDLQRGHGGYPVLFENPYIRRMLHLANAGVDDTFCDLGCGLSQNLIIAASEFDVHKAVGLEGNEKRFIRAAARIKLKNLSESCYVFHERYERVLEGKSKNFKLEDATIVFYGLATVAKLLKSFEKRLRRGCKLIYYNLCMFPEIMPDKVDYPFYLSKFPFRKTNSELEWIRKVVGKEKSIVQPGKTPNAGELWGRAPP
jgi:hypothetical protein